MITEVIESCLYIWFFFVFWTYFSKKHCLEFYSEAVSGVFLTWKRPSEIWIFSDWALRPRLLTKTSLPKFAPSWVVFWQSNSFCLKLAVGVLWSSDPLRVSKKLKLAQLYIGGNFVPIVSRVGRKCQKCEFLVCLDTRSFFNNYLLDCHYDRFIWQLCLF